MNCGIRRYVSYKASRDQTPRLLSQSSYRVKDNLLQGPSIPLLNLILALLPPKVLQCKFSNPLSSPLALLSPVVDDVELSLSLLSEAILVLLSTFLNPKYPLPDLLSSGVPKGEGFADRGVMPVEGVSSSFRRHLWHSVCTDSMPKSKVSSQPRV